MDVDIIHTDNTGARVKPPGARLFASAASPAGAAQGRKLNAFPRPEPSVPRTRRAPMGRFNWSDPDRHARDTCDPDIQLHSNGSCQGYLLVGACARRRMLGTV